MVCLYLNRTLQAGSASHPGGMSFATAGTGLSQSNATLIDRIAWRRLKVERTKEFN